MPLNVPESVKLPLKLSVRCEPLATARAAALRATAAFEGRLAELPRLARVHREAETEFAYPLSRGVPIARTVCFFWGNRIRVRVLKFGT